MKLSIQYKLKKDLFVALFQNLKNCCSLLCILFEKDHMFIQGMDVSHICLFEVKFMNTWFDSYEAETKSFICFNSQVFYTIISITNNDSYIELEYNDEDQLYIHMPVSNESGFNKHFKLPLAEVDYEILGIPDTDYDVEFSLSTKQITEIVSQMLLFGSDIHIKCTESCINLISNGISGDMSVSIPIDDLKEYSIVEDEEINASYSLNYIHKMCLNHKLSSTINFYLHKEFPMKILYDLGENSAMVFYIAPKICD